MATSAFKSTSRRSTATEPKAPPPATASRRRSHSVSAVSRKIHDPFDDSTFMSTEFSNSRDNPLFWATSSSSPDEEQRGKISEIATSNSTQSYSLNTRNTRNCNGSSNSVSAGEHRGRSVTRNFSDKKGIGRSVSRVRGRSVSGTPCRGAYESEKEQDMVTSTIARSRNEIKNVGNGITGSNSVRNRVNARSPAKNAGLTRILNQATEWSEDDSACSLQISNLEDGISIGSLSEAEEKTIKAVCEDLNLKGEKRGVDVAPSEIYETVRSEVRRAIADIQNDLENAFRRNNVNSIVATDVTDMPSDSVNPGPVELISDIRREYAIKLEESEERARKLRADLAIEEHRGQELDRILKEILPDPKTSGIQRSRRGRRASNERKRMSKRLTEEAMAYFDECVSLSTFDSSDFSAPEDPPYSSIGASIPLGASSLKESPSNLCCYDQGSSPNQKKLYSSEDSELTTNSSSAEPESTHLYEFSFADKKPENAGPQDNITSYIKNFERGSKKSVELEDTRSYYDAGEYILQGQAENLLIDRVMYYNRIESGGLLLCGGAISCPSFSVM